MVNLQMDVLVDLNKDNLLRLKSISINKIAKTKSYKKISPISPRFNHLSGTNLSGSGKYFSELDTTKCGKMT